MGGFFGVMFGTFLIGGSLLVLGVVAVLRLFRTNRSRGEEATGPGNPDEARMIQEIYQGLTRLEERVESLETLILEQEEGERR